MSFTIYLVEDEENLNDVLTSYLKKEGWTVHSFLTGETAQKSISSPPDLWVLDIMLPDLDGYQLIREIKATSPDIPVIFISARDADIDRILGLEMGSDDYLAKPFLPRELVIRVQKLLQRIYGNEPQERHTLSLPPYTIDLNIRLVYKKDKSIELTAKEFDLLVLLGENQGQAFGREQLLHRIWGDDYYGTDRVVDDLVRRLRKKLPDLRVETIYGYGYRMTKA
jgi:two-component system response regulator CssR